MKKVDYTVVRQSGACRNLRVYAAPDFILELQEIVLSEET